MKNTVKPINFTDLFCVTNVDSTLHAHYGSVGIPFQTHNSNLVWNRDTSIEELLKDRTKDSWAHDCCALDTTREATTLEIISGLGGLDVISKHLYAYQNISQIVGHSPSYRRCFGENFTTKEEMNLFFTIGKSDALCTIGVYFGPYPKHEYSVFAHEAIPSKKEVKKENFFQRIFPFLKKKTHEEKEIKWPKGTRVFLIGDPSEVFPSRRTKPSALPLNKMKSLEN